MFLEIGCEEGVQPGPFDTFVSIYQVIRCYEGESNENLKYFFKYYEGRAESHEQQFFVK